MPAAVDVRLHGIISRLVVKTPGRRPAVDRDVPNWRRRSIGRLFNSFRNAAARSPASGRPLRHVDAEIAFNGAKMFTHGERGGVRLLLSDGGQNLGVRRQGMFDLAGTECMR